MAKAKQKLKLDDAFEELVSAEATVETPVIAPEESAKPQRLREVTRLVGAQLSPRYSRSLNFLSAETGKTNRQILEEALDDVFTKYGAKIIDV